MSVKPIFFALDGPKIDEFEFMLKKLEGQIFGVKVGLEMFISEGPKVVEKLKKDGWTVFLDLKIHDIPNTVKKATKSANNLGADFLTIHIASGKDALQEASLSKNNSLKILGVSQALTSSLIDTKTSKGVSEDFLLAKQCSIEGVICPPSEIQRTKNIYDLIVTPGIRLNNDTKDDQKNTTTPENAISAGAKYIVMGRSMINNLDYVLNELDI